MHANSTDRRRRARQRRAARDASSAARAAYQMTPRSATPQGRALTAHLRAAILATDDRDA